jgi:apolipoprotein N-acyltransferase
MRKYITPIIAGLLLTLGFAPFNFMPAAILGLVLLLQSLERIPAFKAGYVFGFAHFLTSLYWIAYTFLVDKSLAYLIPIAMMLMPATLAVYTGLVCYAYSKAKKYRILAFPAAWLGLELVRSWFFYGGFPWNLLGYTTAFHINFMQLSSLITVYGLSFLVALIASLIYHKKHVTAIVLTATMFVYGVVVIKPVTLLDSKIAIVQPNIPQDLKWDPVSDEANLQKLLSLLNDVKIKQVDLVVLPEAALPYKLVDEPELRKLLTKNLKPQANLVVGSMHHDDNKYYNALFVLNNRGEIVDRYYKNKLVQYGEFVPMRELLPFLSKITPGSVDLTRGNRHNAIEVSGHLFSPSICYEAIFPIYMRQSSSGIINITNDAWFGDSSGPRQHLTMLRFRSIENAVPTIRAANTGISAYIDRFGRIIKSLPLNATGVLLSY